MNPFASNSRLDDQFKATLMWNKLIEILRMDLQVKNHKRRLRLYKNCFVASRAVDCLYQYLKKDEEFNKKITNREQVVTLLNTFLRLGIIRKVYAFNNKSTDFKDNRELFAFTDGCVDQEENKENLSVEKSTANDNNFKNEQNQNHQNLMRETLQTDSSALTLKLNGSVSASYRTANESIFSKIEDKKVDSKCANQSICLNCAVETEGNNILRFLTKISRQKWPLNTSQTGDRNQNISANVKHCVSFIARPCQDVVDGRATIVDKQELRSKSMQLLGTYAQTIESSNPFSKTNPLYRTLINNRYPIHMAPKSALSNQKEPIYNRSLHPNSLPTAQAKFHQQRSFNTLV